MVDSGALNWGLRLSEQAAFSVKMEERGPVALTPRLQSDSGGGGVVAVVSDSLQRHEL